jgi:rubrerythrin
LGKRQVDTAERKRRRHVMEKHNLIKIFEYALNQEETGKSFFETSVKRMGIGAAVSAFNRLIQEENKHIQFINRIIENIRTGTEIDLMGDAPEFETVDFFDSRQKSEFLEQCLQGSMVPDVTVFNTAWLIERDLSEFYETMAGRTDGIARKALQMLSRWEKGHETFFKEFRDKLADVYSQMPWGG